MATFVLRHYPTPRHPVSQPGASFWPQRMCQGCGDSRINKLLSQQRNTRAELERKMDEVDYEVGLAEMRLSQLTVDGYARMSKCAPYVSCG